MKEILKQRGYKITSARLAILEVFIKNNFPITAEKIYKELKKHKDHNNINEATVYRTLVTLEDGGIVKKVYFRKDSSFFELIKEHHHHIACLKCDTVEDFKSIAVEKAIGGIIRNSSKFINVNEHSLELFGFCKNCVA